jgi:outer membrane protein assembly factor BamA
MFYGCFEVRPALSMRAAWFAGLSFVVVTLAACAPQHKGYVHAVAGGAHAAAPRREAADAVPTAVRIVFEGNQSFTDAELVTAMQLHLTEIPIDEDELSTGILRLDAFYYDRGYLKVEVKQTHATEGPYVDIRVHVEEGERYHLGRIMVHEVDGKGQAAPGLESSAALRARVLLQEGQWFDRVALVKGVMSIQTLYRDAGYGHVEVNPETEPTPATDVVNLTVSIVRKGLTYVSTIRVNGAKDVPLAALKPLFRIHEGELFNETRLLETKQRLQSLPFFSEVDCSIEDEPDHTHIRVVFDVAEASQGNAFALRDTSARDLRASR